MKRTKRLSFLVAMIIAITNIVFISMPMASAQDSNLIVGVDFEEGYTPISSNAAATMESMQDVCDMDPWWYSVKPTVFNKAADITENTPFIASVINAGDNNMLRLTYHEEAGIGTNITDPSQTNWFVYDDGSYEVSFRLYVTGDVKIIGVGGKQEGSTVTFYQHNILTKSGNVTYMGDTESSSPAGQGGLGISANTWYTIKLVVNNDLGNYSVEILDRNGASIQRAGGINFKDGCPAISNIRFQSQTSGSVVYLDDYVAKKVSRDNLLYEDDFDIYSGFSGTTTAGANLFKEVSQFRVLNTGSAYALGANDSGKYFVLNKNANAVYMPWNGHILTKDSQAVRGKLQLKFSFCMDNSTSPTKTAASFRVICADNFTSVSDLADAKYTMFRVQPFSSGGNIVYGVQKSAADNDAIASYQQIQKGIWYDVRLTFDLVEDKVLMELVQSGTTAKLTFERSTGLYNGATPLESIKSIAVQATDGMIIGIDDFELSLLPDAPKVNTEGVAVTDFAGNSVLAGATDVSTAISNIKIPFTKAVTDDSVKNITLTAEGSETAFDGYTAENADGVYTMSFNKTLAPNTKYTLSVPTTVKSAAGVALSESYTYEFTTGADSDVAEMEIDAVSVNSVEAITNGGKIQIRTKYANTVDTAEDCLMIVAYYDTNNALINSSCIKGKLSGDTVDMNFVAVVDVPSAELLDLSKVEKVSVYLWDSYGSIRPYCESVDILRTTADSE